MSYDGRVLDSLHEAGHAVVCIAQGGSVESVTTAATICDSPGPWERAVVCFAGAIAARRLGPRRRDTSRWFSDQDEAVAKYALEDCGGIRRYAIEEAERLVRLNDDHIKRVALALRERSSLTGDEVLAIMGRDPSCTAAMRAPARRRRSATVPTSRPAASPPTGVPSVRVHIFELNRRWHAAVARDDQSGIPPWTSVARPTREEVIDEFGRISTFHLQTDAWLDIRADPR